MEQFWVLAQDGREYGPADLQTLLQWLREGRLVASTLVRRGSWAPRPAGTIPELGALFPPSSAPGVPPDSGAPPDAPHHYGYGGIPAGGVAPAGHGAGGAAAVLPREFRVWGFIGTAWELVKPHWLPLAAMFLIFHALSVLWHIGWILEFIVGGPLMVGIWTALLGLVDGRPPNVGMMFERFDRFLDAFLANLVATILILIGFIFLIVPGIILMILWMFAFPVISETRLGFWEAMKASAQLTRGYRWELFFLGVASVIILLLGLAAFIVGVFIALPVVFTAFALAYRFLQERQRRSAVPAV